MDRGVSGQDAYKVYNESEIIGTTSPELRSIKKKQSWWQVVVLMASPRFPAPLRTHPQTNS
jgi:hypothetical protein